ncbi:MAG: DUF3604 domain-containing protein, partial [Thermococcus sp.]
MSRHDTRRLKEKAFLACIGTLTFLAILPLFHIILTVTAKGLPVIHPFHRARVQIETPLAYLVVADNADYLGDTRTINEPSIPKD